ncbi:MAG: PKD domain-containing protein, partial [Methanomicrobiaceae archaeon]|nr:PKD domain-containing protein [Methanomicrobiaceae archaeon]
MDGIEGISLKILFDPVYVSIEGVRANESFSGSEVMANIDNDDGWARILLTCTGGISVPNDDPVPVIDLDVHAKENTGTIPVSLTDTSYSKDFFPYEFDGAEAGSVTIVPSVTTPEASFSADSVEGSVPFDVTFTDASTNTPTSWSWDFGDGSHSTAQNPVHEYTAAGNFTVTLAAANSAGSDTLIRTDYVLVSPA